MSIEQKLKKLREEYLEKETELISGLTKEQRLKLNLPIKSIVNATMFTANGVDYIVTDRLSLARYEKFEELQLKIATGHDYGTLFKNTLDAYNAINETRYADAAVLLYNTMSGIKDYTSNDEHAIYKICALFINRANEDAAKYDETLIKSKIEDWKKEGIDYRSFFSLALGLSRTYMSDFEMDLGNISTPKSKKQKEAKST